MNEYRLVVCEKPSVARSIAAVLDAGKRGDGFLSGGGYLVSWCFGHLAELSDADAYDEKYGKWRREDLPILPDSWQYTVSRDKQKQMNTLRALMHREDVCEVINACDAGREGELIFRTAYNLNNCRKRVKRLWISSMEDAAILDGFDNLRDGAEYDNLYASALCRSKADWLVGIFDLCTAVRTYFIMFNNYRRLSYGHSKSGFSRICRFSAGSTEAHTFFHFCTTVFTFYAIIGNRNSDSRHGSSTRTAKCRSIGDFRTTLFTALYSLNVLDVGIQSMEAFMASAEAGGTRTHQTYLLFYISASVALIGAMLANMMRSLSFMMPTYSIHHLFGASGKHIFMRMLLFTAGYNILPLCGIALIMSRNMLASPVNIIILVLTVLTVATIISAVKFRQFKICFSQGLRRG